MLETNISTIGNPSLSALSPVALLHCTKRTSQPPLSHSRKTNMPLDYNKVLKAREILRNSEHFSTAEVLELLRTPKEIQDAQANLHDTVAIAVLVRTLQIPTQTSQLINEAFDVADEYLRVRAERSPVTPTKTKYE